MRAWLCVAGLVSACGPTSSEPTSGSSGVPGDKRLSDLTVDEATSLCLELADDFPERTVTCSNGDYFSAGYQPSECQNEQPAPATCTALVGHLRDCAGAFYNSSDAALCAADSFPSECDPLVNSDCPF